MKKIKILLLLGLMTILTPNIWAYWSSHLENPQAQSQTGNVVIGKWIYSDLSNRKVIYLDLNAPDTWPDRIEEGTIVIVEDNNENLLVYETLHSIDRTDQRFNPTQPNTNWAQPMIYSENTAEYRWFHHYYNGDIVIFNKAYYRYTGSIPHNPNTITQTPPSPNSNRWEHLPKTWTVDPWFRYVLYNEGDIVSYKGKLYESTVSGNSNFEPDLENNPWRVVGTAWSIAPYAGLSMEEEGEKEWQEDKLYHKGDQVLLNNERYILSADRSQGELPSDFPNIWEKLEEEKLEEEKLEPEQSEPNTSPQDNAPKADQGTLWKEGQEYHQGEIVVYKEIPYQLIADYSVDDIPDQNPNIWQVIEFEDERGSD
ncbi:hypothetical protein [Aerococcus sanguinicola]|uniref:hypothetical protein n=1 Tax=Aerococcus sanguinicola TaxID=119206 RepID=UPI0018A72980|nr:hypothetical protein [Aerococcus sanguinicola]